MTVKLSDYGVRGPWSVAQCDSCGQKRSCIVGNNPESEESFAFCVPCIVRDIEAYERAHGRMG